MCKELRCGEIGGLGAARSLVSQQSKDEGLTILPTLSINRLEEERDISVEELKERQRRNMSALLNRQGSLQTLVSFPKVLPKAA